MRTRALSHVLHVAYVAPLSRKKKGDLLFPPFALVQLEHSTIDFAMTDSSLINPTVIQRLAYYALSLFDNQPTARCVGNDFDNNAFYAALLRSGFKGKISSITSDTAADHWNATASADDLERIQHMPGDLIRNMSTYARSWAGRDSNNAKLWTFFDFHENGVNAVGGCLKEIVKNRKMTVGSSTLCFVNFVAVHGKILRETHPSQPHELFGTFPEDGDTLLEQLYRTKIKVALEKCSEAVEFRDITDSSQSQVCWSPFFRPLS
jgi:hypothetical protein